MALGLLVTALGFAIGLFDWRKGVLACLAVGFLQDPLRKLAPGQPVGFVVLVGIVFAGCTLGFLMDRGFSGLRGFFALNPGLEKPVTAFIAIVVLQSAASAVVLGNPILAGIGLLSYLSPLVALFLGYEFCRSQREIGLWQRVYLFGAMCVGASILLSFAGFRSRLFESIGEEFVYTRQGTVHMIAGLMRSSEIAAWHAAAAACLVILWAVGHRQGVRSSLVGGSVLLVLIFAIFLTGRRKMLGELVIYLIVFSYLVLRWRRGASKILGIALTIGILAGAVLVFGSPEDRDLRLDPYLQRGYSAIGDAPQRLWQMTGMALGNVVERNGWLGRGAGTGAQGSQYFGGGVTLVGGSSEGGLGRITAELGVPGLLIALWLAAAIGMRLWRVASTLPRIAPEHAIPFFGFFALLPANGIVFLTAQQTFGDPFVLIVLGFVVSSAMAYPRLALVERYRRAQAAAATQASPVVGSESAPATSRA